MIPKYNFLTMVSLQFFYFTKKTLKENAITWLLQWLLLFTSVSPLAYTMAKQVDTKLTCYALKIIILIINTDTIILKGKLAKFVLISEINFYVQLYLVVR